VSKNIVRGRTYRRIVGIRRSELVARSVIIDIPVQCHSARCRVIAMRSISTESEIKLSAGIQLCTSDSQIDHSSLSSILYLENYERALPSYQNPNKKRSSYNDTQTRIHSFLRPFSTTKYWRCSLVTKEANCEGGVWCATQ